jgi:tol-pal system protein YbgF
MTIMVRFPRAIRLATVLAAPTVFAFTLTATASAQDVSQAEVQSLNQQVTQVQRELDVLQRHVYQGRDIELAQAQAPANYADFQVRLEELEGRMRDMTGRMEELNHRIAVLNERFEKLSSDVEYRLNNAQPGGAAPGASGAAGSQSSNAGAAPAPTLTPPPGSGDPSRPPTQSGILGSLPVNPGQQGSNSQASVPPAASAPAQNKPLPDGSPEEQYKYAFSLLTKSDYPGAERAFEAFLTQHPNHALAGNAQYWLGESYYVRNDFNNAARAFAIGFQKYPKSPKGPDNLLKLGLSLAALDKNKEACQSYGMLRSEFPKAPQEVTRRAEAEQKRLHCR